MVNALNAESWRSRLPSTLGELTVRQTGLRGSTLLYSSAWRLGSGNCTNFRRGGLFLAEPGLSSLRSFTHLLSTLLSTILQHSILRRYSRFALYKIVSAIQLVYTFRFVPVPLFPQNLSTQRPRNLICPFTPAHREPIPSHGGPS